MSSRRDRRDDQRGRDHRDRSRGNSDADRHGSRSRRRDDEGHSSRRQSSRQSRSRSPVRRSKDSHQTPTEVVIPPEAEAEARRMAEIAARAEAKAAKRLAEAKKKQAKEAGELEDGEETTKPKAVTKEAAPAKPQKVQFLTKAQRQKLAMERLASKRKEAEEKRQQAAKARQEWIRKQEADRAAERDRSGRRRDDRRGRDDDRRRGDRRDDRDRRGSRHRDREGDRRDRHRDSRETSLTVGANKAELKEIREQYLGRKQIKKKVVKPSEKFTKIFQFAWDASEDTSVDNNPLYASRADVSLMFGRGYVGGIDFREQRKKNRYVEELTLRRQRELRTNTDMTEEQKTEATARSQREMDALGRKREKEIADLERSTIGMRGAHWSEKKLEDMKPRDWRIFREDFDIRLRGGRAALPLRSWDEANLPANIRKAIDVAGYKEPSPIQRQAIPIGNNTRDVIGVAETGSGKTAAFVIPMLQYILRLPKKRAATSEHGPLAIILAPVRELAQQIAAETEKLAAFTDIKVLSIVGGQDIHQQWSVLQKGVDVVVGTPGRLVDCLAHTYLVLNQCNYVVLDEADKMIDMGFEPQVVKIFNAMSGTWKSKTESEALKQEELTRLGEAEFRTTIMFSATMPPAVENLARTYLRFPAIVYIGDKDSSRNKNITQELIFMPEGKKKQKLFSMLETIERPVIVFCHARKACDAMSRACRQAGYHNVVLHGGKSQQQREESLELFKIGEVDVLIATDVAGRGLDIPGVMHVINYDMPTDIQRYCHRIGRTGRAGKQGTATSFVTEGDNEIFVELEKYMKSTDHEIPPWLRKGAAEERKKSQPVQHGAGGAHVGQS